MTRPKVAFVTGVTGQDGAHLASQLLADGWEVYGGFRRGSSNKTWRMDFLGISKRLNLIECQLSEPQNLIEILQQIQPAEIYHLAGESFVADSFKYPGVSLEANSHGALNVLEAVRLVAPDAKLFCASSSEVFGHGSGSKPLDETTECLPSNPYGISKLAAQHYVRLYRERYGLFACSGILFNHEGPLRGREYVTRKITFNIARLKVQGGPPIELGDLNAARDWGAASDYVRAMRAMLAMERAQDFVIATGRQATVRDVLRIAAASAGYEPEFEGTGIDEKCVDKKSGLPLAHVSRKYFRVHDTPPKVGDPSRLESLTGWRRLQDLEMLIGEMVAADIDRWRRGITNV
jgi:GDPmannose 4,6-dehydratase